MLKYIKNVANSIDGVSIYPLISLLLFFAFFIILLYYVKKMDKNKVDEISRIPLEDEPADENNLSINNLKQA